MNVMSLEDQLAEARARAAAARAERERYAKAVDWLTEEAAEARRLLMEYDVELPQRLAAVALGEKKRRSYLDLARDRRCMRDFLDHAADALRHLQTMQKPHDETHRTLNESVGALERQIRDDEIRATALEIIAGGDFGESGRNRPGPLLDAVRRVHPLADAGDLRRVMRW